MGAGRGKSGKGNNGSQKGSGWDGGPLAGQPVYGRGGGGGAGEGMGAGVGGKGKGCASPPLAPQHVVPSMYDVGYAAPSAGKGAASNKGGYPRRGGFGGGFGSEGAGHPSSQRQGRGSSAFQGTGHVLGHSDAAGAGFKGSQQQQYQHQQQQQYQQQYQQKTHMNAMAPAFVPGQHAPARQHSRGGAGRGGGFHTGPALAKGGGKGGKGGKGQHGKGSFGGLGKGGHSGNHADDRVDRTQMNTDKSLQKLLEAFVSSPVQEFEFKNLNPYERRWLHHQCDIYKLAHKSRDGPPDDSGAATRVLVVSKQQRADLTQEDIHQAMELSLHSTDTELIDETVRTYIDTGIFDKEVVDQPARPNKRRRAFNFQDSDVKPKHTHRNVNPAILRQAQGLPAAAVKKDVLDALRSKDTGVVIVSGETGSGKTTQIPQFVLDSGLLKGPIVCTQPRRISATSVAERVATERGVAVGGEVGYQVRFERCVTAATRLVFVTTGILLRMLQGDAGLRGVQCVIVDEVHERDADTDFCLLILRRLLKQRRADGKPFKVFLMSATLTASTFQDYFAEFNPRLVAVQGKTFPVRRMFLHEVLQAVGLGERKVVDSNVTRAKELIAKQDASPQESETLLKELVKAEEENLSVDCDLIVKVVEGIVNTSPVSGAILVFLPGWADIEKVRRAVQASQRLSRMLLVLRCHSDMRREEQNNVFKHPPMGMRKLVLATNIAETSITIPDVVHVVDSAMAKGTAYRAESDMKSLHCGIVSQSSMKQRSGRAGRTQAGFCYTLITEDRHKLCDKEVAPEMTRIPLQQTCLQAKALLPELHISAALQEAVEPPSDHAISNAIAFLTKLGALTSAGELTNMGKVLAMIPTDPLIGKLLITGALFRVLQPVCVIAAFLSLKSPFLKASVCDVESQTDVKTALAAGEFSDHTMFLRVYREWKCLESKSQREYYCSQKFVDHAAMMRVERTALQFERLIAASGFLSGGTVADFSKHEDNSGLIRGVLFAGLYPHIGWIGESVSVKSGRKENKTRVVTEENKPMEISRDSVNTGRNVHVRELARAGLCFMVYSEQMFIHNSLQVSDATLFGPVPVVLFAESVEWQAEAEKTVASIAKGWRHLSMAADDALLLRKLRHLLAFFSQKCLERVDAGVMPPEVVRSFASAIGYPLPQDATSTYVLDLSDAGSAASEDDDEEDEEHDFIPTTFIASDGESSSDGSTAKDFDSEDEG